VTGSSTPSAPRVSWGLTAALWLLVATPAFTMDAVLPAQPAIGAALGGGAVATQWIITAMLLGYALGQLPLGLAADRWGRFRVGLAGMVLVVAGGAGAMLATTPEVLLASRALQGFGGAGAAVVARAVARDVSGPDGLSVLMSGMIAFLTAMTLLSPVLGGLALGWLGWRAVLGVTVVYSGLALLLLLLFMRETRPAGAGDGSPVEQLHASVKAMLANPQSLAGCLLVALTHGGYFTFVGQGSSVAIEVYGLPAEYYGLLFALPAGANAAMSALNRRWAARYGAPRMLAVSTWILGAAGLMLLGLSSLPAVPFAVLWGAIVVYMLGQGLLFPNATSLVLMPVPQAAGFAASVLGTLQIASGTVFSALAAVVYAGSFTTLALFLGAAGLGVFLVHRFGRTEFVES